MIAINGAGGTLGSAISWRLAAESDAMLVLSDVDQSSLDETVDGGGAEVVSLLADVGDFEQVVAVVDAAVERFGRLDVLISNAGVLAPNGRIHNLDTEDWERAFRVNCVCPGTLLSGIHDGLPREAVDAISERHPLGLGSAGDIVGAYEYLTSDAAKWVTGAALVVDGGCAAP